MPTLPHADWIIERVAMTGSTNADLLARFADADAPIKPVLRALQAPLNWTGAKALFTPRVRVAKEQSAGRGRQGRQWASAPGQSLLFSIGVVLPLPVAALSGLSLAAGTAVLAGLRRLSLSEPARLGLKWPNDIELDDAKLGGILIETAASSSHASAVVIGVGLNLRGTPPMPMTAPMTAPAARRAASLAVLLDDPIQTDAVIEKIPGGPETTDPFAEQVLENILAAFAEMFVVFSETGFSAFRGQWWDNHRMAGQWVQILDGGKETLRGRAVGVDDSGRLLVESTRIHAVASGDVSLRPLAEPSVSTRSRYPLLLIDAGNSRVKWALLSADGQPFTGGPVDRSLDEDAERTLLEAWRDLPKPQAIWMSNVAGEEVMQRITALLTTHWPDAPLHQIRAQAQQCGVTNHYQEPSKLGSDRWAGMIAARAAYPGEALLIATLGTATTVDAMDEGGHFIGGLIAPGWTLMMRSLGEHTAQLPKLSAADASAMVSAAGTRTFKGEDGQRPDDSLLATRARPVVFADTTAQALVEGCRTAQAGVILAAWQSLGMRLGCPVRCIVGGGAAAEIAVALPFPYTLHENLVLEGLAHIARDN